MMELIYKTAAGRFLIILMQKTGLFELISRFLKSKLSKGMVPGYIKKHDIDMRPFAGDRYDSFADFFGRRCEIMDFEADPNVLMSPCDGLLSIYPITEKLCLPMKGSHYRLSDILPDTDAANAFENGICLVFRLQPMDYHHFVSFDDLTLGETHYLPGLLHSVQPIALMNTPVYRQNRRWWTELDTEHFGKAVQIEVGAMMVGGVSRVAAGQTLARGAEMGNFELAGSTIILLLTQEVKKNLKLYACYKPARMGKTEIPVRLGKGIGVLKHEV